MPAGRKPTDGSTEGGVYTNTFFQFSLQIPDGWAVLSAETAGAIYRASGAIVGAMNPALRGAAQYAVTHTQPLMMAMEGRAATQTFSTKSMKIFAASLPSGVTGINPVEYLGLEAQIMRKARIPLQPTGEPEEMSAGGKRMARLDVAGDINGNSVRGTVVAMFARGYLVLFDFSNPSGDETDDQASQTMESLRFFGNSN